MKTITTLMFVLLLCMISHAQDSKPNILLIAIDDLNDWVGVYDGHPQAKTPNIDKFAEKAIVFRNASCPGPVCGPSRSSLLSGYRPSTSGIYGNTNNMLNSELVQEQPTLPEYFSRNGYVTISSGKIFHKHGSGSTTDHGQWAYDVWQQETGSDVIKPSSRYSRHEGIINGVKVEGAVMDGKGVDLVWGVNEAAKEETKDYVTAKWFEQKLQEDYDKPFFMLAGLSKPHLPFVAPQEFYDLFGLDTLVVPEFRLDDLDDILDNNGKKKFSADADFTWIEEQGLHKEITRAYLAASSYADNCVGVMLDALASSKYADNTIVMIWGDHGWHLGEKLKYRKASLWKESTQLPFIFHVPGMDKKEECFQNVNLLDIYPTLIDLCGLPQKELDGISFVPIIENPDIDWHATITTRGKGSHSVMYKQWHYITYNGNGEELYDLDNDPMEWTNLANIESDEIDSIKQHLRTFLPEINANEIENKDVFLSRAERQAMLYGASQTITFPEIPIKNIEDDNFDPGASASSGLPLSYTSSNTDVATVIDQLIHIEGEGETLITAMQEGNEQYKAAPPKTQLLTVVAPNVYKLHVSVSGVSIIDCPLGIQQAGDTFQLSAAISPDEVSDKSVSWSSSNTSVASVDESGFVTTHDMGNAYIRVTANDIGFNDECLFLVDGSGTSNVLVIDDQKDLVKLYPNPVSDQLFVKFSEKDRSREIIIYNSRGQVMFKESAREMTKNIDLRKIAVSGFLMLQINSDKQSFVQKVCAF